MDFAPPIQVKGYKTGPQYGGLSELARENKNGPAEAGPFLSVAGLICCGDRI
jgi:hypothetical protein